MLDDLSDRAPGRPTPVVAFDLDGTLFDARPRTLEILLEYREEVAAADPDLADALLSLGIDDIAYLLTDTLKQCGVYRADRVREVSTYWHDRYFTDEYIQCDLPLDGAPEYVRACHERGATVVYLSGRDIPGMLAGTVTKLRDEAFPVAVAGAQVILKPDPNMHEEAFKRGAIASLSRLGEVVAFFDNEPANCNLAKVRFPGQQVVLVDTHRVPGAPALDEGIDSVADFRLDRTLSDLG